MANQGGFYGKSQASSLLTSNRNQLKSEKSSLSGSFESPKSYGSTTKPVRSEVDTRLIGHVVESTDTLQGLSIRYAVSVEEIRRVNKLWTNDNIHFYKILKIPLKTNSRFVDLDEVDVDVEQEKYLRSDCSKSDLKKETIPDMSASNEINATKPDHSKDSVSSFLEQLDITIKRNVKQSEKLRLQTGKELMEKMERDQHASDIREGDLFRSLPSTRQRSTGRLIDRSKSDMLNSDDQFFEL